MTAAELSYLGQILIAVLTFGAQATLIAKRLRRDLARRDATEVRNDFIGLAFALLASAFFALLLTDFLVFGTGRLDDPAAGLLPSLLIAVATALLLVLTWRRDLLELGILISAVATLLMLFLSARGPFVDPAAGNYGSAGSALLRMVALLGIVATAVFYILGDRRRLLPSLEAKHYARGLAVLTLLCAIGAGVAYQRAVRFDPKNPKLEGDALRLFDTIASNELGHRERRSLYLLASEAALEPVYLAEHQESRREILAMEASRSSASDELLPEEMAVALSELVRSDPSGKWSIQLDSNRFVESASRLNAQQRQRFARLGLLRNYFNGLEASQQEAYLIERMRWIHLIDTSTTPRVPIALPGLTPRERLTETGTLRRQLMLLADERGRESDPIRRLLKSQAYDVDPSAAFSMDPSSRRRSQQLAALPEAPEEFFANRLDAQVRLSARDEGYLAFVQYRALSRVELVERLSTSSLCPIEDCAEAARRLLLQIEDLPPSSFDALRYYGRALDDDIALLEALGELSKLDLSLLADDDSNVLVDFLFNLLAEPRRAEVSTTRIASLARDLLAQGPETRRVLFNLYRERQLDIPLQDLFDPRLLTLADEIVNLFGADHPAILEFIVRPMEPAVSTLGDRMLSQSAAATLRELLDLPTEQRDELLLKLATRIYEDKGEHALSRTQALVAQTAAGGELLAVSTAALLHLPVLLLCLLAGRTVGGYLRSRERLGAFIEREDEKARDEGGFILGTPVEFGWRESVVRHLASLSGKGWGTVALAGRRGVGKSRTLYHLYGRAREETSSIAVWLTTPSQFDERDFVRSALEQLAHRVEDEIARSLGAEPLASRVARARLLRSSLAIFALLFALLMVFLGDALSLPGVPGASLAWMPFALLLFLAALALAAGMLRTQPVDLSRWLERARPDNLQITALYRRTRQVLGLGFGATRRASKAPSKGWPAWARYLLIVSQFSLFVLFGIVTLAFLTDFETLEDLVTAAVLMVFFLFAWLGSLRIRAEGEVAPAVATDAPRSTGVSTLIESYRNFAREVVERLRAGALGDGDHGRLVVCIDELDKVVGLDSLRELVRRIKGIFEIPGVYYYISISEDALSALYLGSALGKNEIDSSVDHIVHLTPLPVPAGEELADQYLEALGQEHVPERLASCLATLSAGIPRDIIRRCDDLVSSQVDGEPPPAAMDFVRRVRRQLVHSSRLAGLDRPLPETLEADDSQAIVDALRRDAAGDPLATSQVDEPASADPSAARIGLLVAVHALLETAVERLDEAAWYRLVDRVCDLCYRIPIEPPEALARDLRAIVRS